MSNGCVMEGLVSTVCLLFLLIGIQNGKAEKFFGNIKMQPWHEDLLLKCEFPDILPLKINFQDKTLYLNLFVNHAVSANVPVYVMSDNGEVVEEDLHTEESTMAYQDKNNMAAIVITCSLYHLAKKPLSLEGKIIHKGKAYNVELVDQGKGQYVFTPSNSLDDIDSVTSLVHRHVKNPEIRSHRRFKRNTKEYLIDVLLITDHTIYDQWLSIAGHPNPVIKRIQTLANIRKYYTVSYNWVNLIFQNFPASDYKITVFVTGFIISENKTSSFLTEPYRSGKFVYGLNVLNAMKQWIKNSTEGEIPPHDHIQLYSRMDFTSDAALQFSGNKGRAFTGTVCAGSSSVSYVEEMGGFNSADVAAHELTHSFGSDHDGEQNWCNSADQNLMSKIFDPTVARSNIASDCTIYFVRQYMKNQVTKTPDCMLKKLNTSADVPNMENDLPGTVYEADAQCQQVHGARSFHCRNSYVDSPDDFCHEDLYCYDPIQDVCDSQVPALGTSCDDKSWCMDGECRYDDRAPERDSDCLFGDIPSGYYNITETGESCAQRILTAPYDCYDDFFSSVCCKSCGKIKRDVQDCEFGDHEDNCYSFLCGKNRTFYDDDNASYESVCCATCFVPTTTSTTSITTTELTTTTPSTTTKLTTTAPQTTTTLTTTRPTSISTITATPSTTISKTTTTTKLANITPTTTTGTTKVSTHTPTITIPTTTNKLTTITPPTTAPTTTTKLTKPTPTTTAELTTTATSTPKITNLPTINPDLLATTTANSQKTTIVSGTNQKQDECAAVLRNGADCSKFADVCCITCGNNSSDDIYVSYSTYLLIILSYISVLIC
ncbi:hypothetical protein SNE40_003094 [Patella caerulea]|uniref:Peptidase M12B domain-containing protein n=1 Tax=Patella caerulea TaxID=87958 RepID=A0AAN8K7C1_PATCE